MNKKNFRFAYIDAFAGTGYRTVEQHQKPLAKIFPEFFEEDSQQFLAGSGRIALQVGPRFTKYIFIERDLSRLAQLEELRSEFNDLQSDIMLIHADANSRRCQFIPSGFMSTILVDEKPSGLVP